MSEMSEAVMMRRRVLDAAQRLVRAAPGSEFKDLAAVLDALGDLVSAWTGETVRIRMTAEGQEETLDLVKPPTTPSPIGSEDGRE